MYQQWVTISRGTLKLRNSTHSKHLHWKDRSGQISCCSYFVWLGRVPCAHWIGGSLGVGGLQIDREYKSPLRSYPGFRLLVCILVSCNLDSELIYHLSILCCRRHIYISMFCSSRHNIAMLSFCT